MEIPKAAKYEPRVWGKTSAMRSIEPWEMLLEFEQFNPADRWIELSHQVAVRSEHGTVKYRKKPCKLR